MRGWFLALCVLFELDVVIRAQCPSLIPNGGFETYSSLPNDDCGWVLATGWTNAATTGECNTSNGTPDYFHLQGTGPFAALPLNYFSNVQPFEGDAVMGLGGYVNLVTNAREYISIQLSSPLVVGNEYNLSFSMAIGTPQVGGVYADGWGFLLSTGPVFQPAGTNGLINAPGYQQLIPQVFASESWQTFTFTFTADQAYDQFTFGNFLTDQQQSMTLYGVQDFISLAYVFVDDFVLQDNNQSDVSVDLGPDLTLCSTNITLDGTDPNANAYAWNTGPSTSSLVVNTPGLYVLEVFGQCGSAIDSILITECPPLSVDLGPDVLVCPGVPFSLDAAVTGGVGPFDFVWSPGNFQNVSSITATTSGSVTYIVQVTDANGSIDSDTIFVTLYPTPESVDLGADAFICPGETVFIDATVTGATGYLWSDARITPGIVVTEPGTYSVQVNFACSSDDDEIVVTNGRIDVPDFVTDVVVCDVENLPIGPAVENNSNFVWSDDEAALFPRVVYETGMYEFEVTDDCGVRNFEVLVNEVNCDCAVYIPNSFTPNNDWRNEVILPVCECGFTRYDFKVFNRWGDLVFESNDPNQPWIGHAYESSDVYAQDGIYHWVLNADSPSLAGILILHNLRGSIQLLR